MTDLPKQVQQALDEAEAIEKQLEAPATPPDGDPAADPATPPAAADPPPAPVDTPPAVEPPKLDNDYWEQRFKTLQGMYDAERRTSQAQIQQLTASVNNLTLEVAKANQKAPAPAAVVPAVTDKDAETFGPEIVDLVRRASTSAVAAAQALWETDKGKLEATIASLTTKTDSAVEHQSLANRHRYNEDLRRLVPDFEAINATEAFKNYCREIDPIAGQPRQKFLDSAWDGFDAQRTANYFAAYKATLVPPPAPAKDPPNKDLARQVTPSGGAKPHDVPADAQDTRIWTTSEIDAFYSEVRKGVYRGRDAEQAAIEAQIDRAAATNRVR